MQERPGGNGATGDAPPVGPQLLPGGARPHAKAPTPAVPLPGSLRYKTWRVKPSEHPHRTPSCLRDAEPHHVTSGVLSPTMSPVGC